MSETPVGVGTPPSKQGKLALPPSLQNRKPQSNHLQRLANPSVTPSRVHSLATPPIQKVLSLSFSFPYNQGIQSRSICASFSGFVALATKSTTL
jgi:hypothetical protein